MADSTPHFTSLRISSEEVNSLPLLEFEGKVTIVNNAPTYQYALSVISKENIVGFDTESRPAFKKGQSFPVSIIQISTHNEAFIFQLFFLPFGEELANILSNPNIKKVGVATGDDIIKLQELYPFKPSAFIDLSKLAKKKGILQTGARALTARYLGKRLSKTAQRTNWSLPKLSTRQITYAALDAFVCLNILPLLEKDPTDYIKLKEEEDLLEAKAKETAMDNSQALSYPFASKLSSL